MKNTLYIIGNGFDLFHQIPTAYINFRKYIFTKNITLKKWLNNIYGPSAIQNDMWWSNFETMLGQVDYANISKVKQGTALAPNMVDNLNTNLSLFFGNWIKEVNTTIRTDISPIEELDSSSLFFTFNYTMLLEKVYQINSDNIWHIHGSIDEFKKNQKAIIVGHDIDMGQLLQYSSTSQFKNIPPAYLDLINQAVGKGAKKVHDRIESNLDKFNSYTDIIHFIVMGFSFNDIDMPYIKKIIDVNNNIHNTKWTIYWHTEGEDTAIIEKLQHLNIKKEQITTKYW